MPAAIAIPAIVGAGATITGAAINAKQNSSASKNALAANNQAAQLQYKASQDALAAAREEQDYQRWLTSATNEARKPFLDSLSAALGDAPGGYDPGTYHAGTFTAPTMADATNDAGYQFTVAQGQKGLERSAAAKGNLLTGGTPQAVEAYTQGMASNQFDKVYNRARDSYSLAEQAKQAEFDRNSQAGYQAASLRNQAWQQRLSSLAAMAQFAGPSGTYPGGTAYPTTWQPGMPAQGSSGVGGGGNADDPTGKAYIEGNTLPLTPDYTAYTGPGSTTPRNAPLYGPRSIYGA